MSRFDRYLDPQERASGNRFARYAEPQRMGQLAAFGSGAADAFSFGFGDEIQGALFGEQARDAARRRQENARADRPGSFFAGQLGGSLAGGFGAGALARGGLGAMRLAAAARGIGPLGRIAIGAGVGGVGGSLYGAGDAPDDMRMQGAANMFIPGAAFGAGGQALGEVGGRVIGAIGRSMSPEARAGRMMAESLDRFGSPASSAAAVEHQVLDALQNAPDNAMVADVVPGMPSLVRGAGVRPSRERETLRGAFDARNNAMGQRAADDAWQTLNGTKRQDPAEAIDHLQEVQRQQAAPLFAEVHAGRVARGAVQPGIRELMRRNPELFEQADRAARASILRETGNANPTREALEGSPLYWHRLLENVQAEVGAVIRQSRGPNPLQGPRGSRVAEITADAQRFNGMVRGMLGPKFRDAMDIYSGSARGQEAVQRGYDAVTTSLNSLELGELGRWLSRATNGERELMRTGALGRLTDMLENADGQTGRADVLRSIMRNEGQRRVLERIFGGTQRFNDLMRRLDTQRDLFRTSVETGIGVNSHTADRMAALNSQQALTQPATGIRDALFRMLTRDATDRFDEGVSNSILETAGLNANQAASEIRAVGGFQNWAGGRGLLSRAIKERQRMLRQRPDALANAFSTNLYAPTVGASFGDYGL